MSGRVSLVVINSFYFACHRKFLFLLLVLKDSFTGYSILGWSSIFFLSSYCLVACLVSVETSAFN